MAMSGAERTKQDPLRILIAGTGGQGVITSARLLAEFFLKNGSQVVSAQLHGMSQRGGMVQSTVMVNCGISPTMRRGDADFLLGFEPVESVRALPLLSSKTIVIMNTSPVVPYVLSQQYIHGAKDAKYPDLEVLRGSLLDVTPHVFDFDGAELAREAGDPKTLNMVMLGAFFGGGELPWRSEEFAEQVLRNSPLGSRPANVRAFASGREIGKSFRPRQEA